MITSKVLFQIIISQSLTQGTRIRYQPTYAALCFLLPRDVLRKYEDYLRCVNLQFEICTQGIKASAYYSTCSSRAYLLSTEINFTIMIKSIHAWSFHASIMLMNHKCSGTYIIGTTIVSSIYQDRVHHT